MNTPIVLDKHFRQNCFSKKIKHCWMIYKWSLPKWSSGERYSIYSHCKTNITCWQQKPLKSDKNVCNQYKKNRPVHIAQSCRCTEFDKVCPKVTKFSSIHATFLYRSCHLNSRFIPPYCEKKTYKLWCHVESLHSCRKRAFMQLSIRKPVLSTSILKTSLQDHQLKNLWIVDSRHLYDYGDNIVPAQ